MLIRELKSKASSFLLFPLSEKANKNWWTIPLKHVTLSKLTNDIHRNEKKQNKKSSCQIETSWFKKPAANLHRTQNILSTDIGNKFYKEQSCIAESLQTYNILNKLTTPPQWRSVTHPISWSHHRLLLAAQFVEDVVGKLDAARPQLPCRE